MAQDYGKPLSGLVSGIVQIDDNGTPVEYDSGDRSQIPLQNNIGVPSTIKGGDVALDFPAGDTKAVKQPDITRATTVTTKQRWEIPDGHGGIEIVTKTFGPFELAGPNDATPAGTVRYVNADGTIT